MKKRSTKTRSTKTRSTKPRSEGVRPATHRQAGILPIPDCKHFQGYKPCFPGTDCLEECADPSPRGTRILIINLEAMGNVLVTTTLLPELKRRYPVSTISWLTLKNSYRLLDHNPYLDEVLVWDHESLLRLGARTFDLALNIDKAASSCALMMSVDARKKVGYGLDRHGVIVPLNREAEYNYRLGLNDHLKFRVNQQPNTRLLTEAMGLRWRRDAYVLRLSDEERSFARSYRREVVEAGGNAGRVVVGLNTGCSTLYPNKKLTLDQHEILISKLSVDRRLRLVLVGGPEDTERNAELVRRVGSTVVSTPTSEGVRRGLCYIEACDVVISGDSFGMHAAIGLGKFVVVWFGVSCPQEIDLFDRGIKIVPEGLVCSPCWKKECPYNLECIQMADLDAIVAGIGDFVERRPVS